MEAVPTVKLAAGVAGIEAEARPISKARKQEDEWNRDVGPWATPL